jgi:hypothetical protein
MAARTNIVEFRPIGLVWTVAEKEWTVLALAASPAVAKLLILFRVMREFLLN